MSGLIKTMNAFFLTGTDTEIGKTTIAAALLRKAGEAGLASLGLKPVAAGCEQRDGEWQNDDALQLMAAATVKLDYSQVNPVALPAAIAPHLAAKEAGVSLEAESLAGKIRDILTLDIEQSPGIAIADFTIIEGAGGWLVPLNETETFADMAVTLQLPVILVVGIRLGCINHALLTAESIANTGLPLAGWVANCIDPDAEKISENIETLKAGLPAPCIGVVPYHHDVNDGLSGFLQIDSLVDDSGFGG